MRLVEHPPAFPSSYVFVGVQGEYAVLDAYWPEPVGSYGVFQRRYLAPKSELPPDFLLSIRPNQRIQRR